MSSSEINQVIHLPILSESQYLERLRQRTYVAQNSYVLLYSSWLGGVVMEPYLWTVPMDDHLVHRGDGVFEAIKARHRHVWLMQAHLERLERSATRIGLRLPHSTEQIRNIILEMLKMSKLDEAIVRVFVSRGPGYFTVNPADSVGSQLYLAITKFSSPSEEKFKNGVCIGRSQVAMKSDWMPQVKSCNYLPNVLMKAECLEKSWDFSVNFSSDGFLGESATENIMLVNKDGVLCTPSSKLILKGTSMLRACQLAEAAGLCSVRHEVLITEQDLLEAREVMIIGTTLDVLPVSQYESVSGAEGESVRASWTVGPLTRQIQKLVWDDQKGSSVSVGY